MIHPRENDLILATHGRSVWIFDDATPIQQMTAEIASGELHLFDIRPAIRYTVRFTRYGIGDKVFAGPNPPYGALITYHLKNKLDEKTVMKMEVLDAGGKLVKEVKPLAKEAGLNRAVWDLRYEGPRMRRPPTDEQLAFFGGPRGPQVLPGLYTVRLTVGDKKVEKRVEVRMDPTVEVTAAELQTQFDQGLKVRDMQSAATDALRTLDSVKEQLQSIEKTVKDRMPDASKELAKTISDHLKQVESLENQLTRPQGGLGFGGKSEIADTLGGYFFMIDGVNAGPTPYQTAALAELQPKLRQKVDEVNRYINQTLPQLNEALKKNNAPVVVAGKPIDMPK
jgi:hypothetical protein